MIYKYEIVAPVTDRKSPYLDGKGFFIVPNIRRLYRYYVEVKRYNSNTLSYEYFILLSIEKFDTLVKLDALNKEKIAKITNYSEAIYLNFSHSGKLPNNTLFKVYVGDKYNDGDKLNLYFYSNFSC